MRIWIVVLLFAFSATSASAAECSNAEAIDRGRYLTLIAGCNDCHTSGYGATGGKIPESEWLKGDTLGFSGPWGTTYPTNLRKRLATMELAAWKTYARNLTARPPMPFWALNAMTDGDLEAFWYFTRSLGDAGDAAPQALPPGDEPPLPTFRLLLPKANGSTE
jgi:mono/diheme cytochrome c family protein